MYGQSGINIEKIANGFLVTFPLNHEGMLLQELSVEEQFEVQGEHFMKGAQKVQNRDELLEKLQTKREEARKKNMNPRTMQNVFYFASEEEMFKAISEKLK